MLGTQLQSSEDQQTIYPSLQPEINCSPCVNTITHLQEEEGLTKRLSSPSPVNAPEQATLPLPLRGAISAFLTEIPVRNEVLNVLRIIQRIII